MALSKRLAFLAAFTLVCVILSSSSKSVYHHIDELSFIINPSASLRSGMAFLGWHASTGSLQPGIERDFTNSDGTPAPFSGGFPKTWGTESANISLHDDITYLSLSPDGSLLAAASVRYVQIISVAAKEVKATICGHEGHISNAQFSPDGKTLVTSSERWGGDSEEITRVWSVEQILDGSPLEDAITLDGRVFGFGSQAFTPDGKYILYARNINGVHYAAAWDIHAKREAFRMRHDDSIMWAGGSPDGRLIGTSSWDKTVRLFDAETGEIIHALTGASIQCWAARFSPDSGMIAAGAGDKLVHVWQTGTGARVQVLKGFEKWIRTLSWSKDGRRLAAGAAGGTVRIFDVLTGESEQWWQLSKRPHQPWTWAELTDVRFIEILGREVLVFKTQNNVVEMYDPEKSLKMEIGPKEVQPTHWVPPTFVIANDGNTLISADADRVVRFWDLA